MRIYIYWAVPCTTGYRGWLVCYEPNPSGHWMLMPTAGDSYSLGYCGQVYITQMKGGKMTKWKMPEHSRACRLGLYGRDPHCAACGVREFLNNLISKMALERCDPDVMPYFEDYYWIPKSIMEAIRKQMEGE